jgi:hypothetical protein
MIKVLVGSKNPVKLEATKEAFSKFFDRVEIVGIEVIVLDRYNFLSSQHDPRWHQKFLYPPLSKT